jgi:NitT/TauT family transport system permease protein
MPGPAAARTSAVVDSSAVQAAESAARRRKQVNAAIIVGVHLAVIALWQLACQFSTIPRFILPSPLDIIGSLWAPHHNFINNTLVTSAEIFGGYLLGIVVGVAMAVLFTWSPILTVIVMPLFVTLNMIPKVALGPLIIVWFSYGIMPNILITFSICCFPVLLTTARGLREVEPDLLDLVRSLRGSRWQLFRKIQLPGALPYVFSGMKVGAILAVAGATVGEFIASERGLGYLMIQVQSSLDTAAMMMALILLTAIGMVLYGLVLALERLVVVQDDRVT